MTHANIQKKYEAKKKKTHTRVCFWVPKNKVDAVKAAIAKVVK